MVEASREFIVGRWQVEQVVAGGEGGSFVDYGDDGKFTGKQEVFVNGNGGRQPVGGTWHFGKLAKDQFRMDWCLTMAGSGTATFRILDHEHIHNLGENYVAIRVAR